MYVILYIYITHTHTQICRKKDKTPVQPLTHYNWTPLENALASTAVCSVCRTNRKRQHRGRGQKSQTACQEEGSIPPLHFRKSSLEEIIPHRSEDSLQEFRQAARLQSRYCSLDFWFWSMSHKLVTSWKAWNIYLLVIIIHLCKLLDETYQEKQRPFSLSSVAKLDVMFLLRPPSTSVY